MVFTDKTAFRKRGKNDRNRKRPKKIYNKFFFLIIIFYLFLR